MSDSKARESTDLWSDFELNEGLKPGRTDGSQWVGKYDRRSKPRDNTDSDLGQSDDAQAS